MQPLLQCIREEWDYADLEAASRQVSFTLTNTGPVAGAEVAQLYIAKPDSLLFRPALELKGFAKVSLAPGESRRVTIPLDAYAFRYFNVKTGRWEVEGGAYQVMVGASCADIRLSGSLSVEGSGAPAPYDLSGLPHYITGQIHQVTDQEFTALLGRPIPPARWNRAAPLTENDTFSQLCYAKGWAGRLVYRILRRQAERATSADKPDLNALFRLGMPFRAVAKMTAGMVDMDMVRALVELFNGRFCRGAVHLLAAWRRKRRLDRKKVAEP